MQSILEPTMNALLLIEPRDLELLLNTEPGELLGRIMRLNRTARYHNSLDAVRVIQQIIELRRELGRGNVTI